jgi:hypothetical protein
VPTEEEEEEDKIVCARCRVVVLCVWLHHPSGGAVVSTGYALQRINTKHSTNSFINILYFNTSFKLLFKA